MILYITDDFFHIFTKQRGDSKIFTMFFFLLKNHIRLHHMIYHIIIWPQIWRFYFLLNHFFILRLDWSEKNYN